MDQNSAQHDPLLPSPGVGYTAYFRKTRVFVDGVKWVLKIMIWVVFVAWITFLFLYPVEFFNKKYEAWIEAAAGNLVEISGRVLIVFSSPVIIIAVLALAYNIISASEKELQVLPHENPRGSPSYRLWTFPVLVDGPFGVVSAAELIGILVVLVYIIWAFVVYNIRNISELLVTTENKIFFMFYMLGICFAEIGVMCLAFLFLPVARGSILLRFINIPFEHAVRYHVWLGNLTMLIFTLHGLSMIFSWTANGDVLREIVLWENYGVANLAGVITLLIGLLIWVTSLPLWRRRFFELFFYTHQLYFAFILFFAMHIGDYIFSMTAGGIFLFFIDRFLRFCQSRRAVEVISARCLPCGVVELTLSKPPNLRYNALSFVFLQVREVSWLQWHPFSVSTSPLDGKSQFSVLIKVQGQWTRKLKERISSNISSNQNKITASVEGPYGYESPYYLMYRKLVLVAGGIGISPFLAILCDVLHRLREGKSCPPTHILLVWAIRTSSELCILSTINMESICPSFSDKLNLEIHVYVTQESGPPLLEEGHMGVGKAEYVSGGQAMSGLVSTGNKMWFGAYVVSSIMGFIVIKAVVYIYYIGSVDVRAWWYRGVVIVACMVASVVIFGGLVVCFWYLWERTRSECENSEAVIGTATTEESVCDEGSAACNKQDLAEERTAIVYGSRPNFKEILGSIREEWGCVDVGVIVCGPWSLESSVAKECKSLNTTRQRHHPIFHFNSHSFKL